MVTLGGDDGGARDAYRREDAEISAFVAAVALGTAFFMLAAFLCLGVR